MGSEELEEEIEVLRAIYGDDAVLVVTGEAVVEGEVRLEVDLQPRVEQGAALVSVTVTVLLPLGYPVEAVPKVHIERSRGLGDAALGSLLAAARRACEEHGLQEVGCVSQLLMDVSEALDVANDTSECNICLLPCCPGESTVHTSCDHIFHSRCIGYWDALKAAEVEADASDASQSSRATRNSLRREVDDAASRQTDITLDLAKSRGHAAKCAALADVARIRHAGGRQAEELEIDAEMAEALLNEEGEEIELEELVEKARLAKAEEKRLTSDERKAQARLVEMERKLEEIEARLSIEAAGRAGAGLPCPVCRASIDRSLLPERGRCCSVVESATVSAPVQALPAELRKQVREVQTQHHLLLERRREKEIAEAAAAAAAAATTTAPETEEVAAAPGHVAAGAAPAVDEAEPACARRGRGAGGKGDPHPSASPKGYRKGAAVASGRDAAASDAATAPANQNWNASWDATDSGGWSAGWSANRSGPDAGKWGGQGSSGSTSGGRGGRWRK